VRFTGTDRLRLKESDRLAAMADVFASPADVDTKGDHRIAMAAAVLSTALDGPMLVQGASCVAKSYPGFWEELRQDLYIVTGWPLLKTRSPEIHNAASAEEGRRAEMTSFPAETVEEALRFADLADVKGMAVTIPHKERVMAYLDEIDPVARAIGAVNTVVFRDGRRLGFNTDSDGFAAAVTAFVGAPSLKGVRTAVLGAGGAARAISVECALAGAASVAVINRNVERGQALADVINAHTKAKARYIPWVGTAAIPEGTDILINATCVGLHPNGGECPDVDFGGVKPGMVVCDVVFNPAETVFLKRAAEKGAVCVVGHSEALNACEAEGLTLVDL
jgi:shikimate dehydrogenase